MASQTVNVNWEGGLFGSETLVFVVLWPARTVRSVKLLRKTEFIPFASVKRNLFRSSEKAQATE